MRIVTQIVTCIQECIDKDKSQLLGIERDLGCPQVTLALEETECEEAVPDLPAPAPILACSWVYATIKMVFLNVHWSGFYMLTILTWLPVIWKIKSRLFALVFKDPVHFLYVLLNLCPLYAWACTHVIPATVTCWKFPTHVVAAFLPGCRLLSTPFLNLPQTFLGP